jgi:hypothetical protein
MLRVLIFVVKRPKKNSKIKSCFVFAPSYNAIARVRSRSKCFLCIFVYFMTIALLVQVVDIVQSLDIFVQLSSSSNRFR